MDETRGDDRDNQGMLGSLVERVVGGGDSGRGEGNDDLAPTVLDDAYGTQSRSQDPDLSEEDVDQSAGGA